MKDIAIYGAGGFGREAACLINRINDNKLEWNFLGFFDDTKVIGEKTPYGPILGGMTELNRWNKELFLVIAIGNAVGLTGLSRRIINPDVKFPNLIAPDTIYHDKESIVFGKGNVVFFRSIISCNVKLGDFNLLNNDVFIGHDSVLGSCNVFNPSTRISGNVEIGDGNFFGVSSVVLEKLKIGHGTTIGANSVIIKKTQDNHTYYGNPAIKIN